MKSSELIGPALNWAVFTAKGFSFNGRRWSDGEGRYHRHDDSPSTDWAQGGPIIEQESLSVSCADASFKGDRKWVAHYPESIPMRADEEITGPTPLIAAMRCFVASRLGNEVEIPKELL